MRVTVRLFARLREIVGAGELALEVDPPATIATIWRTLVEAYPGVEPYGKAMSVARNLEYARLDTIVAEGDEIAFLPPVSGGEGDRHRRTVTVPVPATGPGMASRTAPAPGAGDWKPEARSRQKSP